MSDRQLTRFEQTIADAKRLPLPKLTYTEQLPRGMVVGAHGGPSFLQRVPKASPRSPLPTVSQE